MKDFLEHFSPYIDDPDAFADTLKTYKKRAFRVNECRNVPYFNELRDIVSFSPSPVAGCYFVDEGYEKLSGSLSFQTGGIYIQNPSSVLPARILADVMPENPLILDVSAAPGGKTCALSDYTGRRGLILANEPSKTRIKSLNYNLEKCGAWNVKTISTDGALLSRHYADCFDGVLLDAPCSHENQIGVNKKVAAQWSADYVDKMSALQKRLIISAFDCLKPGGALVYSTCTFSVEENEHVVKHLLDNRGDAVLTKIDHAFSRGVSGVAELDDKVLRIFPHKSEMEGFFTALVRKEGEPRANFPCKTNISREYKELLNEYFVDFPADFVMRAVDRQVYLEAAYGLKGDFRRTGLVFAKAAGRVPELSSQATWEFGTAIHAKHKVAVDYETALNYMKGFDTPRTNTYDGTVFYYEGIPAGLCKIVGGTYKNKLDRYFLYGKNIEY